MGNLVETFGGQVSRTVQATKAPGSGIPIFESPTGNIARMEYIKHQASLGEKQLEDAVSQGRVTQTAAGHLEVAGGIDIAGVKVRKLAAGAQQREQQIMTIARTALMNETEEAMNQKALKEVPGFTLPSPKTEATQPVHLGAGRTVDPGLGYSVADLGRVSKDIKSLAPGASEGSAVADAIKKLTSQNDDTYRTLGLALKGLQATLADNSQRLSEATKAYHEALQKEYATPEERAASVAAAERPLLSATGAAAATTEQMREIMRNGMPPGGGDEGGAGAGMVPRITRIGGAALGALTAGVYAAAQAGLAIDKAVQGGDLKLVQAEGGIAATQFRRTTDSRNMTNPENMLRYGADFMFDREKAGFLGANGLKASMAIAAETEQRRIRTLGTERDLGIFDSLAKGVRSAGQIGLGFAAGGPVGAAVALQGAGSSTESIGGGIAGYVGSEYTAIQGGLEGGLIGMAGRMRHGERYDDLANVATRAARTQSAQNVFNYSESLRDAEMQKHGPTLSALQDIQDMYEAQRASAVLVGGYGSTASGMMASLKDQGQVDINFARRQKQQQAERKLELTDQLAARSLADQTRKNLVARHDAGEESAVAPPSFMDVAGEKWKDLSTLQKVGVGAAGVVFAAPAIAVTETAAAAALLARGVTKAYDWTFGDEEAKKRASEAEYDKEFRATMPPPAGKDVDTAAWAKSTLATARDAEERTKQYRLATLKVALSDAAKRIGNPTSIPLIDEKNLDASSAALGERIESADTFVKGYKEEQTRENTALAEARERGLRHATLARSAGTDYQRKYHQEQADINAKGVETMIAGKMPTYDEDTLRAAYVFSRKDAMHLLSPSMVRYGTSSAGDAVRLAAPIATVPPSNGATEALQAELEYHANRSRTASYTSDRIASQKKADEIRAQLAIASPEAHGAPAAAPGQPIQAPYAKPVELQGPPVSASQGGYALQQYLNSFQYVAYGRAAGMAEIGTAGEERRAIQPQLDLAAVSKRQQGFAALEMSPAEYMMHQAQVTNVLGSHRVAGEGSGIFGAKMEGLRAGSETTEMIRLGRSGLGSFEQQIQSLGAMNKVAGGENNLENMRKVLTEAVAAGFDKSRTAQQFVAHTTGMMAQMGMVNTGMAARNLSMTSAILGAGEQDERTLEMAARGQSALATFSSNMSGVHGALQMLGGAQGGGTMASGLAMTGSMPILTKIQNLRALESGKWSEKADAEDLWRLQSENWTEAEIKAVPSRAGTKRTKEERVAGARAQLKGQIAMEFAQFQATGNSGIEDPTKQNVLTRLGQSLKGVTDAKQRQQILLDFRAEAGNIAVNQGLEKSVGVAMGSAYLESEGLATEAERKLLTSAVNKGNGVYGDAARQKYRAIKDKYLRDTIDSTTGMTGADYAQYMEAGGKAAYTKSGKAIDSAMAIATDTPGGGDPEVAETLKGMSRLDAIRQSEIAAAGGEAAVQKVQIVNMSDFQNLFERFQGPTKYSVTLTPPGEKK